MVADTENDEGDAFTTESTMVDLPTPDGPEMTMSVPLREVLKEGLALVASKAPDCTVVGDADVLK